MTSDPPEDKATRRAREASARCRDYLRSGDPKGRYGLPRESLSQYANSVLGTKRQRKVLKRCLEIA